MMAYVLGIDLGTSSLKGILMNEKGRVISEKHSEYEIQTPQLGYSEQHPEDWITACNNVMEALRHEVSDFGSELEGISFSGQMHSLVVLDEFNQPIYPAILWNDVRTSSQCEEIKDVFGDKLITITGNIPLEGFTLPKILWLQEQQPEVWSRVKKIMLPKDYLRYWFTNAIHCEFSDAAGTLLLDIEKHQWSQELLAAFNISQDQMAPLTASMENIGVVKQELRTLYGLKKEVAVFAGGADNVCAALGAGMIDEETSLVSIGTSGVFSTFEPIRRNYQGKLHFFNHVIPGTYYSMGVTLAAGNSLDWFKKAFAQNKSFEELLAPVSEIAVGSDNLLFTPYIVGERTPHIDSTIRGSFIGMDTHHDLRHFTRAVLEGIVFSIKDSQTILEEQKEKPTTRILSIGGGAKNNEWLQIQADIFNAEVVGLVHEQGPGVGACMIAALGCGWFSEVSEVVDAFVEYQATTFNPIKENVHKYQQLYQTWQKIYNATKEICYDLAHS